MKRVFLDVETTGFDPVNNGIIQLSGIIDVDGIAVDEFDFKINTFKNDIIEESALKVNKRELNEIRSCPPPSEIINEFQSTLKKHIDKYDTDDKAYFIAHNAKFDKEFVYQWFQKNENKYIHSWFYKLPVCTMNMAVCLIPVHVTPHPENFKLKGLSKFFNIKVDSDNLHDSLVDVRLCREIFYTLKEYTIDPVSV